MKKTEIGLIHIEKVQIVQTGEDLGKLRLIKNEHTIGHKEFLAKCGYKILMSFMSLGQTIKADGLIIFKLSTTDL